MRCEACGFVNTDGQKFCNNCGSKLKFSAKKENVQNTDYLDSYEERQVTHEFREKDGYEQTIESYERDERRKTRMAAARKAREQRNIEKSKKISRLLNAVLIALALVFAVNTLCIAVKKTRVDTYEKILGRTEGSASFEQTEPERKETDNQ